MANNLFEAQKACLGQTYFLGPAMDPNAQTLQSAVINWGHVGMLGVDGGSYGNQDRPTITENLYNIQSNDPCS